MMQFVVICVSAFQNHLFSKNSFRNTISESNILDPDQARQNVCKGYQQMTLINKALKWAWFSERLWLYNERKLGIF